MYRIALGHLLLDKLFTCFSSKYASFTSWRSILFNQNTFPPIQSFLCFWKFQIVDGAHRKRHSHILLPVLTFWYWKYWRFVANTSIHCFNFRISSSFLHLLTHNAWKPFSDLKQRMKLVFNRWLDLRSFHDFPLCFYFCSSKFVLLIGVVLWNVLYSFEWLSLYSWYGCIAAYSHVL